MIRPDDDRRARICAETDEVPMTRLDRRWIRAALAVTLVLWAVALGSLLARCAK